jgi:hypothetical protein
MDHGDTQTREEKGTFYLFGRFRGRPRGRKDDSKPNARAVRFCKTVLPNGFPRAMHSRIARTSSSVCGSFTQSSQRDGRGTGPGNEKGISPILSMSIIRSSAVGRASGTCALAPEERRAYSHSIVAGGLESRLQAVSGLPAAHRQRGWDKD